MTTTAALDSDYATFVQRVHRLTGVDLHGYKPEQMRRRLLSLAQRHGAGSLTGFAVTMERDATALAAFKNFFTINVSEFLRDPQRWIDLQSRALPQLSREAGRRGLRVWSAGCSYGAEPYSLAMVLEESAPGLLHTIVATDIDERILARATAGAGYVESDLRNVDAARRARFFTQCPDGSFAAKPGLKQRIRFRKHDLLTAAPEQGLDLIVCRNVVIYFTEDAKQALYQRMYGALRPGGMLFIGGTEVVAGFRDLGFEPVMTSFYRKPAARTVAVR